MGLGITNTERYVELSIPLHDDIPSLVMHLRKLADKLEQVHVQEIPEGKVYPMTNKERVDQIAMQFANGYQSLAVQVSKNWDFRLPEWETAFK